MKNVRFTLAFAALAVFATGQGRAQNVSELYVRPDTLRLEPGQKQNISVQAFDESGNIVLSFRYIVADTSVARIASSGAVTAGRAGRTRITVQAGGKTRAVNVVVAGGSSATAGAVAAPQPPSSAVPPPSEAVRLIAEPSSLDLLPTEVGRVSLRATGVDGAPAEAGGIRWRSLHPEVALVDETSGAITARGTGQATIQATASGGSSLSLPVSVALSEISVERSRLVMAPGMVDSIAVRVPSQGDRRLRATDLRWSVSDPTVVQVGSDGLVRALTPGQAEVILHGFLQERRVAVVVHRRVNHFLASPRLAGSVQLPVRATREFSVVPQTEDSVPIAGVPITWAVGDTTIAVFDTATGRLQGRRSGTTTLTFAAPRSQPRGWTIEVVPADSSSTP